MKRCPSCTHVFNSSTWLCPTCGFAPPTVAGFPAFAPELAEAGSDFFPDAHADLHRLQAGSFWFRARNKLIRSLLKTHCMQCRSVLEIGCGTGYVLENIGKKLPQAKLTGSELDARGLSFAAQRLGSEVTLYQMDALRIPFQEEFDLIAACDVLEHIDEDEAVLTQMAQALKPHGWLLLTVPQHPFLWSRADSFACHKRRYGRHELADKVAQQGLEVVRNTSFVTSLLPLMLIQRFRKKHDDTYSPMQELALPSWLDRLLEFVLSAEVWAIAQGFSLPVGGSRLVLAKKNPKL